MAALWHEVRHTMPSQMIPKLWRHAANKIRAEFSNKRVRRGILTRGQNTGLIVVRNPSSRDGSMEDFERYSNDTPAVLQISQEIAAVLQNTSRKIEISTILGAMSTRSSCHHLYASTSAG